MSSSSFSSRWSTAKIVRAYKQCSWYENRQNWFVGQGQLAQEKELRKSFFLEGFYDGHDSDISLAVILLQCGCLSLPCVFSCKNETQE